MSKNEMSTRRNFLKAGAVLSAPLAAAPVAAFAGDRTKARLAQLEDENALRGLHQDWLRSVNAGTASNQGLVLLNAGTQTGEDKVRSVASQLAGPPDEIEIGADGKAATGRFHCTVEIETPIAKDCTLAQMAHLQGGGFLRRTEPRVLVVDYIKTRGAWSIARAEAVTA